MPYSFVLIIGAMKCGTTTLFDYLAQHPEIAASRRKEVGFFAFEEKWALGFDWFEQQFDFDSTRQRYGLEASTDYTKHPFCTGVAERMKSSAPRQFKLIYIMRHPLRRIESHARHTDRTKQEIGPCTSPRENHSLDCGVSPVSLAISHYARQLDQYSAFLASGDLYILTLEDLSENTVSVLKAICHFLGIDPTVTFESGLVSNKQKKASRIHPMWTSLSRIGPLNRIVRAVLGDDIRKSLRQRTRVEVPLRGRYCLTPDEEAALLALLAPDLVRLRDEYGIDIEGQWGIRL